MIITDITEKLIQKTIDDGGRAFAYGESIKVEIVSASNNTIVFDSDSHPFEVNDKIRFLYEPLFKSPYEEMVDTDGDGIIDKYDLDADGDGVWDDRIPQPPRMISVIVSYKPVTPFNVGVDISPLVPSVVNAREWGKALIIAGYYPCYITEEEALLASPLAEPSSHTHNIMDRVYYMPEGVDIWHGDYYNSTPKIPTNIDASIVVEEHECSPNRPHNVGAVIVNIDNDSIASPTNVRAISDIISEPINVEALSGSIQEPVGVEVNTSPLMPINVSGTIAEVVTPSFIPVYHGEGGVNISSSRNITDVATNSAEFTDIQAMTRDFSLTGNNYCRVAFILPPLPNTSQWVVTLTNDTTTNTAGLFDRTVGNSNNNEFYVIVDGAGGVAALRGHTEITIKWLDSNAERIVDDAVLKLNLIPTSIPTIPEAVNASIVQVQDPVTAIGLPSTNINAYGGCMVAIPNSGGGGNPDAPKDNYYLFNFQLGLDLDWEEFATNRWELDGSPAGQLSQYLIDYGIDNHELEYSIYQGESNGSQSNVLNETVDLSTRVQDGGSSYYVRDQNRGESPNYFLWGSRYAVQIQVDFDNALNFYASMTIRSKLDQADPKYHSLTSFTQHTDNIILSDFDNANGDYSYCGVDNGSGGGGLGDENVGELRVVSIAWGVGDNESIVGEILEVDKIKDDGDVRYLRDGGSTIWSNSLQYGTYTLPYDGGSGDNTDTNSPITPQLILAPINVVAEIVQDTSNIQVLSNGESYTFTGDLSSGTYLPESEYYYNNYTLGGFTIVGSSINNYWTWTLQKGEATIAQIARFSLSTGTRENLNGYEISYISEVTPSNEDYITEIVVTNNTGADVENPSASSY